MNPKDLDDIQKDVALAVSDLGDIENISIKWLTTKTPTGIYVEKKGKVYGVEVVVAGRVKFNPKVEEMTELGRRKGVTAEFLFATGELSDKGLLMNESPTFSEKDLLNFRGRDFDIITINPVAMLGDRFLLYKVEAKESVANG